MQFSHYDKVPQNVQDEVTKKYLHKLWIIKILEFIWVHDNKILDLSTEEIVNTAKRTGAQVKGPIPFHKN